MPGSAITRVLAVLAAALAPVVASAAPRAMLGGRAAMFRSSAATSRNRALIKFTGDSAINPMLHKIACPATTPSVRLRASNGYDSGLIPLPCENWKAKGIRYRYVDRDATGGAVRSLVYRPGKMSIKLGGPALGALGGPLDTPGFVEISFDTGTNEYCGRFESFRTNREGVVKAAKGTVACKTDGPNIIVIVGDDVDWRRLGFMGEDSRMITPSLDRLASEGVTFPAGHLSASVCRPAHHHLLTGLHPQSTLTRTWGTIAEELSASNRRTFQAGKLWEQSAAFWGFDADAGEVCAGEGYACGNADFGRSGWDVATCGILGDPGTPCPATEAWRDFLATIDDTAGDRFFALFTPLLPHYPFNPPQEYRDLYAGQAMTGSEWLYLPMITWFDGFVGEVMADLEAAGMRDDTLVIYLADNGFRSEESFVQAFDPEAARGKNSLYEMGMRSPIIFAWPDGMPTSQGSMLPGIVGIEDVFATVLRLAGRPVAAAVDGVDLEPSWRSGTPSPRSDIVTRFLSTSRTDGWVARTKQWRYIRDLKNDAEHLYAIDIDPDEQIDLIDVVDPADLIVFGDLIDQWQLRNW